MHMNKKKGTMQTWKKAVLLLVAHVLLFAAIFSVSNFLFGTRVEYYDYSLRESHTTVLDPLREEAAFEDSKLFNTFLIESALNDVTVLSVVSNQMETNGKFDGKKAIDITDYVYRREQERKDEVTAIYYLEDLLKWSKYGLSFSQQKVQIDNYENSYYEVVEEDDIYVENTEEPQWYQSISGGDAGDGKGYFVPEIWMKQSINYFNEYARFTDIYQNLDGDYIGNLNVLECRYKTINGKNLEELVDNWEDYFTLVHNLDEAIANLSINYRNYTEIQEVYGEDKSNLKFCMRMTDSQGKQTYISNLEEFDGKSVKEQDVTNAFQKYGKNLYYCPGEMVFESNIEIAEQTVFYMLTNRLVEYAYPETTKVWIGVDTQYPVEDIFLQTKELYENSYVSSTQLIFAGILFLGYLILILILWIYAGKTEGENGKAIHLSWFDRFATELVIIFAIIIVFLGVYSWYLLYEFCYYHEFQGNKILIAAGTVITSMVFWGFFFSLIRRIRGNNLWKDSITGRLWQYFKHSWVKMTKENSGLALRVWLPYLLYLIINLALLFLAASYGIWPFLAALLFDFAIGVLLMKKFMEIGDIIDGINRIRDGEMDYELEEEGKHGENRTLAQAVNNIGDGIRNAVEKSMKDERLKADLITNVSHDIKTPLTSIINYVDLLKREEISDPVINGYIEVLDVKSQRLKQLTEDLVEASKISSGNISYVFEKINLTELLNQAIGEFSEKFETKGLSVMDNLAGQHAYIEADSRRMWRIVENLFNNIYKYALENTRIYLTLQQEMIGEKKAVSISVKNISAQPLNIQADELTERFIRGDVSRSTEGSGLGLSIAKNLTEAQHGKFDIYLDGDLFKVTLTFPLLENE